MVSFNISNYRTSHKVVECKTGVYTDLSTGRRLLKKPPDIGGDHCEATTFAIEYEAFEYDNSFVYYKGEKSKYVSKKLNSPIFASTFKADADSVGVCIWKTNEVNKHGAVWNKYKEYIFHADAIESFSLLTYDEVLGDCLALLRNGIVDKSLLVSNITSDRISQAQEFASFPKNFILKCTLGERCTAEVVFDLIATCRYMTVVSRHLSLKEQKFGVEIEFTGISRKDASEVVANYFGTNSRFNGSYKVVDNKQREWVIRSDGSIRTMLKNGSIADSTFSCELVTPICTYDDIPTIQQIVRNLRAKGTCVNESCGIHVHVDGMGHTALSLRNLANLMAANEDNLFKALNVADSRSSRYCKKTDKAFLERINSNNKCLTLDDVKQIWYNGDTTCLLHYNSTRYHALNLHSLWQNKGIEFRMFNSTTHAGKVKAYIQLCLALNNYARCAAYPEEPTCTVRFTRKEFRTWLLNLGLQGDEFKTARIHLLANLEDINEARSNAA